MYRLFLLCLCVLWQCGFAQPLSSFTFTHYNMATGLASNETRDVVQDRTGYLWIASNNGLQRFDGTHYKNFQHRDADPTSIPDNHILQLLVDNSDNLWLITGYGQAGLFDKTKFTFTPVPIHVQHYNSLGAIKRLIKDEAGTVFLLLHANELLQFNPKTKAFENAAESFSLKPEWRVTGMIQQPGTQRYWFGLQSGGVAIYDRQTKRLSYPGNNVDKEPAIDSLTRFDGLTHFLFDRKGRFWAQVWPPGPYPNIVQWNGKGSVTRLHVYELYTTLKAYHEVHGFAEQSDGRIWVHGNGVLGIFNEAEDRVDIIPNDSRSGLGVVYERVAGVFEDREKNVWVPTGNYGLYRCNPSLQYFHNFFHFNKRNGNQGQGSMMSFAELKNGDVLAGSWGDGLFRYNAAWKEVPLRLRDDVKQGWISVWSMSPSADGNTIWMGCQPGIYQLDQANNQLLYRNPAVLQNRTVRQVIEDKQGNLWLGMHYFGLYKWLSPKDRKKDSLLKIPEVGNDNVTRLILDGKGYLWLTTERKGVFAFETTTGQLRFHWNNRKESDSTKLIEGFTSVLPYNDSLVYISTSSRLYTFNRTTNEIRPEKLPPSLLGSIASMEKDSQGFLWISTENGLYRYFPGKQTLVFFNREDGIATDRFIPAASYRMKDGSMLFGSDNAFIHFNPDRVKFPASGQQVVLTNIQVGRHELRIDSVLKLDVLRLGADENSLTIDFSSLSFVGYSLLQYRLEGIDKEWHTADKDNRASFPILPPAKYTLLMRTLNAEGVPSKPTMLKIYIRPPFYQTWWFYTLIAVLTASLLFWIDRQRTKRKEVLQKVRTDIAGGLHQEVNTALNNINILSEIARLKSEREPAKARDYIEQIHSKSHNMIIALDDMLWSLDPENDAMDKTIQRIREFADALMQRSGALIELLIDKKVERLQLNMKLRHEAFLLFKEGLRSLIDAGTRHCIVHLTAERGKLFFSIEFENEGCNIQKLNNLLQRHDLDDRLHDLKAKLDVQVHKSRSMFLLQLPL